MNNTEFWFRGNLIAFVNDHRYLNFNEDEINHPVWDEDTINDFSHWLLLVGQKIRYDDRKKLIDKASNESDPVLKERIIFRIRQLEARGIDSDWPETVKLN